MASRFFAIDFGSGFEQNAAGAGSVTEGAGTGSKGVEIQIDLVKMATANASRNDVLCKLMELEAYILQAIWPPA